MTDLKLSFKEAYTILKRNAEKLDQQSEPDIDNLMRLVDESMQAYKIAKSRIDAVQAALKNTFSEED